MNSRQKLVAARKFLRQENKKWPRHLMPVKIDSWPKVESVSNVERVAVWRSRDFLVQAFTAPNTDVLFRLSVNRTDIDAAGNFIDGIPWEDLQRLKREAGFGNYDAVEIFPQDTDVINVANLRHLWVFKNPLPFAWRNTK